MEKLPHECGVALVCLPGNDTDAVPGALAMLRDQRHRGRQGAGLAVPDAAGGFSVLKFDDDNSLDHLCDAACALHGDMVLGHVRYATNGRGGTEAVHPFVSRNGRVALCGNFHFGRRYEAPDGQLVTERIAQALSETDSLTDALRQTLAEAHGGFVLCGITADGCAFAVRDRHGIRPAWYVLRDGELRVASERFALHDANARELPAGHALVRDSHGRVTMERLMAEAPLCQCPFERIYFASAKDPDIAAARRALGRALAPAVMQAIAGEALAPVLTYVPNSAVHAWEGLAEALDDAVVPSSIISKLTRHRTFMHGAESRVSEVESAYSVEAEALNRAVIIVDDSIVRGTTFRRSTLLRQLQERGATRIIIVSSAPPILYPDHYGIDIPTREELIAARAAATGRTVAELLTPPDVTIPVTVIYQSIADLCRVLGPSYGTWVFTGTYPD